MDIDKLFRTLNLRDAAISSLQSLSEGSRQVIEAYVEGVNSWLATGPNLPIEYHLFGFSRVENFSSSDVVLLTKLMSLDLGMNMHSEMERLRLLMLGVSAQRIEQLWPPFPPNGTTIIPGKSNPKRAENEEEEMLAEKLRRKLEELNVKIEEKSNSKRNYFSNFVQEKLLNKRSRGSNNWVSTKLTFKIF